MAGHLRTLLRLLQAMPGSSGQAMRGTPALCWPLTPTSPAPSPLALLASCASAPVFANQALPISCRIILRGQASTPLVVPSSSSSPAFPPATVAALGIVTLEQLQQTMAEVMGSQHPFERSLTVAELQRLPSLPYIRARLAALRDEFGAANATKLLGSCQELFRGGAPKDLRHRLGIIAAACGCDFEAALALCTRNRRTADLLVNTAERIEQLLSTLRECLGLTAPEKLLKAVRKAGRILTLAPEVIRERHAGLGSALGLDSDALGQLLRREPRLLGFAPAKVHAGVEAVREGLELGSWEEAVQVASRVPVLLTKSAHDIKAAIICLQRLGLPNTQLARCMIVLNASAAQLEEASQQLPRTLGIPSGEALQLVHARPEVLLAPASTVRSAWADVKRAADLRPEWRAQLLSGSLPSFGRLLKASPGRLGDRIRRIADLDPPSECLPALSTIAARKPASFEQILQRVQAGTFKAGRIRPPPQHESVAAVLPSLEAVL